MFLVTFSGFCSLLVKRGSFSLIQVNELESLPTPPPRSHTNAQHISTQKLKLSLKSDAHGSAMLQLQVTPRSQRGLMLGHQLLSGSFLFLKYNLSFCFPHHVHRLRTCHPYPCFYVNQSGLPGPSSASVRGWLPLASSAVTQTVLLPTTTNCLQEGFDVWTPESLSLSLTRL